MAGDRPSLGWRPTPAPGSVIQADLAASLSARVRPKGYTPRGRGGRHWETSRIPFFLCRLTMAFFLGRTCSMLQGLLYQRVAWHDHSPIARPFPAEHPRDPVRMGFFSIVYSLSQDEKFHWRWESSKQTCERNDEMLRAAGYPGLVVFGTNESMRTDWNVYKLVILPHVLDACPVDVPLCPKINFFRYDEMWTEVASEGVFFLDADAHIISETFIDVAGQYLNLPIDFAALPDAMAWDHAGIREEGPYNTGTYFMRLSAFHNADFDATLAVGLAHNRDGSPSAPNPASGKKKPVIQGEQHAFNTYLTKTVAGRAVRKQTLPWKMHCRGWYITKECWLVHAWYDKHVPNLPNDFTHAKEIWQTRLGWSNHHNSNEIQ